MFRESLSSRSVYTDNELGLPANSELFTKTYVFRDKGKREGMHSFPPTPYADAFFLFCARILLGRVLQFFVLFTGKDPVKMVLIKKKSEKKGKRINLEMGVYYIVDLMAGSVCNGQKIIVLRLSST